MQKFIWQYFIKMKKYHFQKPQFYQNAKRTPIVLKMKLASIIFVKIHVWPINVDVMQIAWLLNIIQPVSVNQVKLEIHKCNVSIVSLFFLFKSKIIKIFIKN